MVEIKYTGDALWRRIELAVEIVKNRLKRVVKALNAAEIPYAVIGGNAVQHWVSQVDVSAVRNTQDVDILVDEADLERVKVALAAEGFIYRKAAEITMFLDGADAKARDAVHVIFANRKVREEYVEPAPGLDDLALMEDAQTLPLQKLVTMKLTSFRDKDRVHVRDMISVGLIDASWLERISPTLRVRLEQLLNDPNG